MIDVIATLKTGKTITDFIEGGPLSIALGDIGLHAARNALNKAAEASAPGSQVWSAVTHLEMAEAALNSSLARAKVMVWVRPSRLFHLECKRKYILTLMAICYRYLQEDTLARRAFERARNDDVWKASFPHDSEPTLIVLTLINPVNWFDVRAEHRYLIDISEAEAAVFESPPGGPPTVQLR